MSAAMTIPNDSAPEVLIDEPMARHTSWRVGGPADRFCMPRTIAALAAFLRETSADIPILWIGLGSNLLVRDGGIRGAVISTVDLQKSIEHLGGGRIRATASVPCTTFARHCVRLKLGPAAFFAGIPGTVGGALAMNAGAYGGETWDRVASIETIDRRGESRVRERAEYEIGYRSVRGPAAEWFVAATFALEPDEAADMREISTMVKQRGAAQPIGKPSCGSVFRNPQGDYAGRLIEAAGLKGARVGGAVVSTKHANFIINDDGASAADIEALIEHVRKTVLGRSGVALELEVRIVGEPATRLGARQ
jgi:UDP-N-acetylmuramate dehydrogenase